MSRIVELPEPVYKALEAEAANRGLTPAAWIAGQLSKASSSVASYGATDTASAKNLGELLRGKIGRIASGGDGRHSAQ